MADDPIRFNPAARFDAEVSRISDELDVDVVFRLVEREDKHVADQFCSLGCGNEANQTFMATCPGHEPRYDVPFCDKDAQMIIAHDMPAYVRRDVRDHQAKDQWRYMVENKDSRLMFGRPIDGRDGGRGT